MSAPGVTVACIRWGTRYPASYVNRLFRSVAARLQTPHRFVCLTDAPDGLLPGVTALPIPDFPLERARWGQGMWPKLSLFRRDLFPDGEVVLFLDLDLVILGALDDFVALVRREGGLRIIREWNPSLVRLLPVSLRPDRGGNSSIVGWIAGAQDHLLAEFEADPAATVTRWRNDQEFITERARGMAYWPYEWCASFKRHCVWYFPLNYVLPAHSPPRRARVVVFHGKPDPEDLVGIAAGARWGGRRKFGFGPVPWVEDYWLSHGD